jgi:ceramide glucosyltransferase
MVHITVRVLQILSILGCISSFSYYLLCLWGARAFLRVHEDRESASSTQSLPSISILKPLKGIDPEIYESFRSHCMQDYAAEYEIIFGVSDANDPAVSSVEQLQREFPQRVIRLVVCPKLLGANIKVSNLEQMLTASRYECILVNDSDIRVGRDYLHCVFAPLTNHDVGMVTCLYRGVASPTLGSRLESLGISTDFCAGVLAARQLEGGLRFGLGSTLAFRRRDLERIGGFQSIVNYLADDYELGRRIAGLGLKVVLSSIVVETHLPAYDLSGFFAHQMRWARGVRDARLGGYIGLASTFGLFWALLNLLVLSEAAWTLELFAAMAVARFAVAIVVGRSVLTDRQVLKHLWMLPVRDLIAVGIWLVSFAGHTVTWRGDRFRLKNGRLIRIGNGER